MIANIHIQNFKSIRDANVELSPINVLIGPNGAGKSNFVEFFNFIYAIHQRELSDYTAKRGGADRIIHLGQGGLFNIKGDVNFSDTNRYAFILERNDNDRLFFANEGDWFNRSVYGFSGWVFDSYGRGHDESKLVKLSDNRRKYVKQYLDSFRVYHFHDTSKNAPLRATARIADTRFLKSDGSNLAAFLYDLQQNHERSFNMIEAVIKLIAPYFERFDLLPNGDYIRLNWRQKGTDIYLDAADFSDGTIRFIGLATLLLQPNLPPTILIDEPELGLHPSAINILTGLVQSISAKTQVILSTQSVTLVNQFEPEDITVVENRNNESIFRRLNKDELSDWLEEYTLGEIWNKNIIGGNP
jgi:predicted ATPase